MKTAKPRKIQIRLDESLLSPLPPFAKLKTHQIREILDLASSRRYEAGAPIFEEGQTCDRFFLLLDGYVRAIRTTPEGEQVIALHIASGQLLGLAHALGRTTYPATASCTTEAVALSWPIRLWQHFVTEYDGFSTETYKTVGLRIEEMNTRIVEMATQHVEQRVASALLRLINQTGRKVEEGVLIDFPITRQDLSEMTGSTLYTVSRLLSAWDKQGLVLSKRKQIIVRDPHQLVLLCAAKP